MNKLPPWDFRTPAIDPKTGLFTQEYQRWLAELRKWADEVKETIEGHHP